MMKSFCSSSFSFVALLAILITTGSEFANAQAIIGDSANEGIVFRLAPASGLINDLPKAADPARDERIENAIERGLALLHKAARNYPSHRQCFSCHHQTLPLLAMREAEAAGLKFDHDVAKVIEDHTLASFNSRIDKLNKGERIGGRANTVSYGLWTLDLADRARDDITTAMVEFLLKTQRDDGRWVPPSNRPPLEESHISVTVLSAYYMSQFAQEEQQDDVTKSIAKARKWLASAAAKSQEDLNFQLWALNVLEHDDTKESQQRQSELRQRILAAQRDDGGWSQIESMESDAYATGQTLYVLCETGLPSDSVFAQSAIDYLLATQHDDGSWLVETRSKPVQVFFDNGDPHGKSQFISIAATSWAVAALANAKGH